MDILNGRLFIFDISGYTEFITKTSLVHAREVITEILERLYKVCDKRLILNKVEGDAIFFYSESLSKKYLIEYSKNIFKKFCKIREDLSEKHKKCEHKLCHSLNRLNIKFFIHEGEFGIHMVGKFEELIGKPIIEIHRVMKNKITEKSYILIIDESGEHSEEYDHIGKIRYRLILLNME